MTLAVGTALQHGTYVIDAWVADDAIGPVYLAMHVPTGQWMQLRVLGSRSPDQLPDMGDRQGFYHYLEQVKGLGNPAFPALLGGFEEEGVCYQTLPCPKGIPLSHLTNPTEPLPPRRSLGFVRQLIELLETLRPLGWAGLRLTPDQVWCDDDRGLYFTGFDLAAPQPSPPGEGSAVPPEEAALVKGLSHLLYFLLTGQRAEATHAPLAVEVRRRHPTLPVSLDTALDLGSPQGQSLPAVALQEWGALLPAIADLPPDSIPTPKPSSLATQPTVPIPTAAAKGSIPIFTVPGSQPDARSLPPLSPPRPRSTPAVALVLTGLVATVSGLGLGLHTRLQPASSASQERLNPNQAFPPLPNWSGETLWQPWEDAPALHSRPDYGTTPPPHAQPVTNHDPAPHEPAAPPPAVTEPELTQPEPTPDPGETWETPGEPWLQPQPDLAPIDPSIPDPIPTPEVAPAPPPLSPPAPLDAPPPARPSEGAAPPPLAAPPSSADPAPSIN